MNNADALNLLWLLKTHWAHFEVFGEGKLPLQVGAVVDVLGDIDFADARAAVSRLEATGMGFAPTAGQIRREVLGSRGVLAPDWDLAYQAIMDGINRPGRGGGGPGWDQPADQPKLHPVIEETVKALGGWYRLREAHLSATFIREMREMYTLAKERADRAAVDPPAARALPASDAPVVAALPSASEPEQRRPVTCGRCNDMGCYPTERGGLEVCPDCEGKRARPAGGAGAEAPPASVGQYLEQAREAMRAHLPDDDEDDDETGSAA